MRRGVLRHRHVSRRRRFVRDGFSSERLQSAARQARTGPPASVVPTVGSLSPPAVCGTGGLFLRRGTNRNERHRYATGIYASYEVADTLESLDRPLGRANEARADVAHAGVDHLRVVERGGSAGNSCSA
jgi:hypothetical protein